MDSSEWKVHDYSHHVINKQRILSSLFISETIVVFVKTIIYINEVMNQLQYNIIMTVNNINKISYISENYSTFIYV